MKKCMLSVIVLVTLSSLLFSQERSQKYHLNMEKLYEERNAISADRDFKAKLREWKTDKNILILRRERRDELRTQQSLRRHFNS